MRYVRSLFTIVTCAALWVAAPSLAVAGPREDAQARARAALALAEAAVHSDPNRAAEPKAACVRVGWKQWGGSGTCIASAGGKSLVVSANHIFSETYDADGQFARGAYPLAVTVRPVAGAATFNGTAIDGDRDADLAFIVVDGTLPVAPPALVDAPVGTVVRHYGIGSGGGTGAVLSYAEHPLAKHRFTSTAPTTSGDSGAGLFDPDGEVVAIHAGRTVGTPGHQRGTPVSVVRRLMAALREWRGRD